MEKAIHITKLENLKHWRPVYKRLYWGVEFCQNLIPAIADTEKVIGFVQDNKLDFTFVSPFVTEKGLDRLDEIFKGVKKNKVNCEIVVNDWGVLYRLHQRFDGVFDIALGRLLTRQERDPAIKRVIEKQIPTAVRRKDGKIAIFIHRPLGKKYQSGIRASYINSLSVQKFLARLGVNRLEFNNTIQGLNTEGIFLKKSLWTPYVNISTTRFCPMVTKFQKIYRIDVCHKECQNMYDELRNRGIDKVICKRGNTIFYKNPVRLRMAERLGIDRIVSSG